MCGVTFLSPKVSFKKRHGLCKTKNRDEGDTCSRHDKKRKKEERINHVQNKERKGERCPPTPVLVSTLPSVDAKSAPRVKHTASRTS
jgi:hypothetical protein